MVTQQHQQNKTREEREREERLARYKSFLSDSSDEEDTKNLVGKNLQDYLTKVNSHLQAEQALIKVWENDAKAKEES